MDAVIRKWGNSPAVRLNSAAMKIAAFDLEQRVTIKASNKFEFKLEDLVAGITRDNVHGEVDFGGPVGKEAL